MTRMAGSAREVLLASCLLLAWVSSTSSTPLTGDGDFETPNPITLVDGIKEEETPKPIILNKGISDEETPKPIILDREKGFEELNPSHVDGDELYQSDMRLTPEQWANLAQRKAIMGSTNYRWPFGIDGFVHVPYTFGDSNVDQSAVMAGISHWESRTCVKFDPVTDTTQPHLRFIRDSGCWSYVGRIWFWEGQDVSIGNGCTGLGTVVHEIGHALGFYHEQSRTDRDSYVVVNDHNIISGREGNFDKASSSSNYSVPYDYSSVMHYGGTYFTKNGHLTIATVYPLAQEFIGSRAGLSHRDTWLANVMYPCIETWLENCPQTSNPCQNEGYLNSVCTCVCPHHTSGEFCENIIGDYYDASVGCSSIVYSEGSITSPNYPSNYDAGLQCVKWIIAPACQRVKLTLNDYQLYPAVECSDGSYCCYWDGLEIRTSNMFDGSWFCGLGGSSDSVFYSDRNQMIVFFKTATNYYRGYQANVEFVADASCTTTTTTSTSTTTPTTTTTTPTTTTTTPTTTTTTPSTTTTTTPTTTTPSTTTTTPTTTTTTTPSTTTTTPTTTTTTTTTTTPTTTTTTAITTPTSEETCQIENNNGKIQWTSPNFGHGNYPNDAFCNISVSAQAPAMATLILNHFQLQSKDRRRCKDYVSFTKPYEGQIKLCGKKTGKKIKLPYFSFRGEFRSNEDITDSGFNISMVPKSSSCHKVIRLTSLGKSKTFKTPRHPNADKKRKRICELWVMAPSSYRVRQKFIGFNLNLPCKSNNVIVNLQGDREYRQSTGSTQHCGSTLPPVMFSVGNEIDLLYQANNRNVGFKVKYTVVV